MSDIEELADQNLQVESISPRDFRKLINERSEEIIKEGMSIEEQLDNIDNFQFPVKFGRGLKANSYGLIYVITDGDDQKEIGAIYISSGGVDGQDDIIQHIQVFDSEDNSMLLPETTSGIPIVKTSDINIDAYVSSGFWKKGDKPGTQDIIVAGKYLYSRNTDMWLPILLHELGHGFIETDMKQSEQKYRLALKAKYKLAILLEEKPEKELMEINEVLATYGEEPIKKNEKLSTEEMRIIVDEELTASSYAIDRMIEILKFLNAYSKEAEDKLVEFFALCVNSYKLNLKEINLQNMNSSGN